MKKDLKDTCPLMVTHELSLFEQQAKILLIIKLFFFFGEFFLSVFIILLVPASCERNRAKWNFWETKFSKYFIVC